MEPTRLELWCSLAHDPAERATILLLIVARQCRATRAIIARLNFARSTIAAQPAATYSKQLMKKHYHCESPSIRSENAGPSYSDFHMWLSLSFTVAKRNCDVNPMNTLNQVGLLDVESTC
nr:uncharacterized protein LOC127342339 [Lolium perenne]